MALENKLGLTNSMELRREEERLSKIQAKLLFETGQLFSIEIFIAKCINYRYE